MIQPPFTARHTRRLPADHVDGGQPAQDDSPTIGEALAEAGHEPEPAEASEPVEETDVKTANADGEEAVADDSTEEAVEASDVGDDSDEVDADDAEEFPDWTKRMRKAQLLEIAQGIGLDVSDDENTKTEVVEALEAAEASWKE